MGQKGRGEDMRKFIFNGFDSGFNAYMQGAIVADVFVPDSYPCSDESCRALARELAGLIADGWTRKEAGQWINNNRGACVKGWRVVGARRIQKIKGSHYA